MPNPNPLAGTQHTIHGTPAADTIVFTAAHTTVNAGEGANTITGTSGHNLINSGAGVDTIAVTSGDNTIQAGAGANTITATTGDNAITTGDGADTITVTSGDNTILAGDGANTIVATSGVNTITTGSGADTITTGGVAGGGNTINAGDGANTITSGAGDDTITGGNGADTITTGAGNDVVDAGDGANTVTTGAGNDTVYSGVDTDTITTGAGDDEIHIQGGTDTIAAGAGNDTLIADFSSATGAVSINTLAGTAAAGYAGNISGLGIATFAGVENFEITSGSFNDVVTTGDGTDVVHAGAGSDTVNLAGGNDEAIYTMAANTGASDVYQGGSGVDTLTLELTTAEWFSAAVQADIANYLAFQAAHTDPITGEADSAVFQFTAFDLLASEFEALNVIVDGVVLDPTHEAFNDVATVNEDSNATAFDSVLINDAAALAYSVALISGPAEGVLTFNPGTVGAPDGSYSFDPNDDFEDLALGETRDVSFVYEVQDAFHGPSQATVTITVTGTNDAPEVVAIDAGTMTEDDAVQVIDLLDGQTDIDNGAVLSAANIVVTDDLGNVVAFTDNGDGTISVDPFQFDALNDGQDRIVTVDYDVTDGIESTVNTATLVVEGVNDNEPPVANDNILGGNGAHSGDVAVFGATDGTSATSGSGNVANDLSVLGYFDSVSILDGSESLADLQQYESVLIYNNGYAQQAAFGNILADYVDSGGGLVVATFAYQGQPGGSDWGDLETDGYLPFQDYLGNYETQTLGTYDASNPIFDGPFLVDELTGFYRDEVNLTVDATLVASWSDGTPLVAIDSSGVIGVTLFPNDFYSSALSGDYIELFANALAYGEVAPLTNENTAHIIAAVDLLANDTDPDGDTLVISAVSMTSALGATVILTGDGSVSYDPTSSATLDEMAEGATMEDTFTYTVSDGNGGFDTATATFNVEGLNDGPPAGIHDLNDQSDSYVGTNGLVDMFIFDIDVGTTDGVNSLISITNFEMGVDRLVFQSENPVTSSYFDHRYSDGLGHENLIGDDFNLMHPVAGHQRNAGVQPNNGDNEFSIYGSPGTVDSIEINTSASDVAIALGAWGPDTPHYTNGNAISTIGSAYNAASDENIDLYLGAEVAGINPLWYDGDIFSF
jgi:VCBS repeat-containing protein